LCLSFLAHERMAWRISSFDMAFSSFGRDLEIVELVFQAVVQLFSGNKKATPLRVALFSTKTCGA
jgi:hypothetical protein